jgi:hypothetical protein
VNDVTFSRSPVTFIMVNGIIFIQALRSRIKIIFMTVFQYLPFIMIALLIASIISALLLKKKDLPVELFVEGLKYENNGHFDEAIMNYENALVEVKKNRFQNSLKNKIIQKLKVLNTIIEYKKNLLFTR